MPNFWMFWTWRSQVGHAGFERLEVFLLEIVLLHAAVHLERADGGDDHRAVRLQAGLAALDVEELLAAEVGAEAGFGHHVVGELERGGGGEHRVAAVRDVGERAAVDEGRRAFQRLHQVGRQRVLEQRGHRALRLDVGGAHRFALAGIADDDVAEPLLEVFEIAGEAEDRHHLGGDGDVEAVLAREAVGDAAERARRSGAANGRSCRARGARRRGGRRCRANCPSRCGCRSAR